MYNRCEKNFYFNLHKKDKKQRNNIKPLNITNEEKEPFFLEEKINSVTKNSKINKAPGHDNITNECIKTEVNLLIKKVSRLFNIILKEWIIP